MWKKKLFQEDRETYMKYMKALRYWWEKNKKPKWP